MKTKFSIESLHDYNLFSYPDFSARDEIIFCQGWAKGHSNKNSAYSKMKQVANIGLANALGSCCCDCIDKDLQKQCGHCDAVDDIHKILKSIGESFG